MNRPLAGTLHLVVYPDEAFHGPFGPALGARPVGLPVSIPQPSFPQNYEVASLPTGSFVLYAFIDIGDDNRSQTRACAGDKMGVRRFSVVGSDAKATNQHGALTTTIDVVVDVDVGNDLLCK